MGTPVQPVGDVQVLGRSRIWPAVALPGAVALALIVLAVAYRYVPWYAAVAVGASLVIAVTRRRNAVLADDVGLIIRTGADSTRSYAWPEIERMGWIGTGAWGRVLRLHPRGGPYDVPGPNASIDVGRVWGPRPRRLPDPLPELLQRHGIKTLLDP